MFATEVPVGVFRPELFCRWLCWQWNYPPGLTQESRAALGGVHGLLGSSDASPSTVEQILMAMEYSKAIQALAGEDFGNFVDWSLEQVSQSFGFPLSHDMLEVSLVELRQLLSECYAPTQLWPRQGFRPLLSEALAAICQAGHHLPLAHANINLVQRKRALLRVHDGLDRCLLCTERFLELLLEFFAIAAFQAGAADREELEQWLKAAGKGYPSEDSRHTTWRKKLDRLQTIRNKIQGYEQYPKEWSHMWRALVRLLDEFRESKPQGDGLLLLITLCDLRNDLRHAGSTLAGVQDVPNAYQTAVPQIRSQVERLYSRYKDSLPYIVKLLGFRRDYTGGLELTLALENHETIVLRYTSEDDASTLGSVQRNGLPQQLACNQEEAECFLFPGPLPGEQWLVNALLLHREVEQEGCRSFKLKPDALPPQDLLSKEFREEAVSEMD